jgi:hypothetical protein
MRPKKPAGTVHANPPKLSDSSGAAMKKVDKKSEAQSTSHRAASSKPGTVSTTDRSKSKPAVSARDESKPFRKNAASEANKATSSSNEKKSPASSPKAEPHDTKRQCVGTSTAQRQIASAKKADFSDTSSDESSSDNTSDDTSSGSDEGDDGEAPEASGTSPKSNVSLAPHAKSQLESLSTSLRSYDKRLLHLDLDATMISGLEARLKLGEDRHKEQITRFEGVEQKLGNRQALIKSLGERDLEAAKEMEDLKKYVDNGALKEMLLIIGEQGDHKSRSREVASTEGTERDDRQVGARPGPHPRRDKDFAQGTQKINQRPQKRLRGVK